MREGWLLNAARCVALLMFTLAAHPPTAYAATVTLGHSAPPDRRVSIDRVSHDSWDKLLRQYVDAQGRVDYLAWKKDPQAVSQLDAYLAMLSTADPTADAKHEAKLAFWINAYNAVTVRGILREYPTSSIRNHTARVFGYNIWKDLLLPVGSQTYSLDAMEHQILRKMKEPRIHFAIVCASRGCPRLLNSAYTANEIQRQLESNTRAFFSDSRHFRYDHERDVFYLSSILDWFSEDFGTDQAALLQTISDWLPDPQSRAAAKSGSVSVSFLDYDWSLNDVPRR